MILNLYGGPGIGKSTKAAEVFVRLKKIGIQTELVHEFAKDIVYSDSLNVLNDQFFVSSNQHHRVWSINNYFMNQGYKDDEFVIVVDSPILMSVAYTWDEELINYINKLHHRYKSLDILLKRTYKYQPEGRTQTEYEAKAKDEEIKEIIKNIPYIETNSTDDIIDCILEFLKR